MSIVMSSIVELSIIKIALWIHVDVDDWADERAIIASNESPVDQPVWSFDASNSE